MINQEQLVHRACIALTGLFRDQVEAQLECVHTRIFNYVLHPEYDYVHCGFSREAILGAPTQPEHVVPCSVLINESFRLIKEGNLSDSEIAMLLQKHWKIATISRIEAKRIDLELGLKSRMPAGWRFEDGDTFVRLQQAEIAESGLVQLKRRP